MTEALKRSGCAVTSSDSPSSLEKSSSSFWEWVSLTRTTSGGECGLRMGEDGPAVEPIDGGLLADIVKQVVIIGCKQGAIR